MTTYYVKTGGSDGASGLSDANAWASIAKCNAFAFAIGDIVQFRYGDTFTGQFYSGNHRGVTFQTYDPISFLPTPNGFRALLQNTTPDTLVGSPSNDDVTFNNLEMKTNQPVSGAGQNTIIANDVGATCRRWKILNCYIHGAGGSGVIINNINSFGWLFDGTVISNLGDNGILFNNCGGGHVFRNGVIHDVGLFNALQGRHGIYGKADDLTIHDNEFYNIPNGQTISIRHMGAKAYNNTIHDTPYAIAFFNYSSANAGKVLMYKNRCWNITGYHFYSDGLWRDAADAILGNNAIDVVYASNTGLSTAGDGCDFSQLNNCNVMIANNIIKGCNRGLYGVTPIAGKVFTEKYNLFHANAMWRWNGLDYTTLAAYIAASAGATGTVTKGLGDIVADPKLGPPPGLVPSKFSPVLDAGTTLVDISLPYTRIGA